MCDTFPHTNSSQVFKIALVFYLNCAKERVTRHFLNPNCVTCKMLPISYESSEPALDYRLNNPGFKSQKGKATFFLLKNVHITSEAHPATYPTGTGVLFQGINLTIHSI